MTGVMFPRQLPPSGAESGGAAELEILGALHSGPEERFDRIALLARLALDVAGAGIAMRDAGQPYLKAAIGLAPLESPETQALAGLATSAEGTRVVEDAGPEDGLGRLARQQPIRFYAGQPVRSADGIQVATLFVADHQSRTCSERDRELLAELEWWVLRELKQSVEADQAAEVQRKLMPETRPQVPGYEIAATCVPCRGVGGDFFDWYPTDRGLAMSCGDVMGKGIGAAMVMSAACSVLRAFGRQYPPAEAVELADLALQEELESTGTMITLCHGELNPETHVLRYVDAGHGLIVSLREDGTTGRVPAGMGSLPLGVLPGEKRSELPLTLAPGETALIFSDGVLDLYDGTAASIDVIADDARMVADQGAGAIVDYFTRRAAETTLSDDVTVCVIRRSPS
ncbi:PP2C family protein-serine/threonine phosphatase [Actinophytocola sp.]|uniref:PP2C family protein-serine/threonine phosphatase n=1 Tax=Actinophytocola sp. TaxID=1872138 RepID=UPI002D7FBE8F|nr:SpoIIE family protein phosphatase [Actinophytocola sp.]HET9138831.1 SpoIIE family protein phosphatase [Actinophytocola sp.]